MEEEEEEKKSHGLMLLFIMIFLPFQNRLLVHFTIIIHSADNEIERTRADEKEKGKEEEEEKNKTNFLSRFPHKVFLIPDLSGAGRCFSPCLSVSVGT